MCVSHWVGPFKVEDQRDVLEVNHRVCIDETEIDALFHSREDCFIILVTDPFQTGEHSRRILSGSEGGVIVKEAFGGLENQYFVIVIDGGEVQWITGLISTVPEVGNATHVRITRGVDGGNEPL